MSLEINIVVGWDENKKSVVERIERFENGSLIEEKRKWN